MAVSNLPRIIPSQYEWSLAIFIPALRAANSWIISQIVTKVPGTNIRTLNFVETTRVMIGFAYYIATRISSLNDVTVYSLFVVELVLHIQGCLTISQFTTKVQDVEHIDDDEKDSLATEKKERIAMLTTSEFVEAFVPVAYGIAFATAYYGPNVELLRNIKSDYFGGKVLEDVNGFYFPLCLMFAFDALGVLISAAFLHYTCAINLCQEFCNLMKEYWLVFVTILPLISYHFGIRDINFAIDFTMKFLWTTDEGRDTLFRNSTI